MLRGLQFIGAAALVTGVCAGHAQSPTIEDAIRAAETEQSTGALGVPELPVSGTNLSNSVPERTLASLTVEEVNAATFAEGAAAPPPGANPLILKLQVLLDRANASPGVIDGFDGENVAKAVAAVEHAVGLPVDGLLDSDVWSALDGDGSRPALIDYEITGDDVAGPFLTNGVPSDYAEMSKLRSVAFTGPAEMFSERFHMDIDLLTALNPGADYAPGSRIVVAEIEPRPIEGAVARIEADKARGQLRAYDEADRLVVAYPATIGSEDNPSPSGNHKISGVAEKPVYYYNPDKNFQQGQNTEKLEIPPGPNNPVGTTWIDLSEPTYGIHGTPEPSKIDKTGSHGCVRLTNWDVQELAKLVKPGVVVSFVE